MAFEHPGDLGDGSQTCIVPRAPIQPDHHILDHGGLPSTSSSRDSEHAAKPSDEASSMTIVNSTGANINSGDGIGAGD
jgi:hypothetical protein